MCRNRDRVALPLAAAVLAAVALLSCTAAAASAADGNQQAPAFSSQ